jgi:hypothetical protein
MHSPRSGRYDASGVALERGLALLQQPLGLLEVTLVGQLGVLAQ